MDWEQFKSLVDAFDKGAMGSLTLIMNQNENGQHYYVAAIVKRGDEFKQVKGHGDDLPQAIENLSKEWGQI